MKRHLRSLSRPWKSVAVATLLPVLGVATPLLAETELLPEGTIEMVDPESGLPENFVFPNKLDQPWLGGNRAQVVEVGGNQVVKFSNGEAFPFFHKIKATVPIPDGATEITVSGRFKAESEKSMNEMPWTGYHIRTVFSATEPPNGEPESPLADELVANIPPTTDDWVQESATLAVPDGAKYAVVQLMVSGLVGTFWFDDISVKVP